MVGLFSVNPQYLKALSSISFKSSFLIGVPVTAAFPSGKDARPSGNYSILGCLRKTILLASPGVISDSVYDYRDLSALCSKNNRDSYKTAL